jgi:hypothetical protein
MAHIAWDAGAITTGPVTVPLIMGIGYIAVFFFSVFLIFVELLLQLKLKLLMDLEFLLWLQFAQSLQF